MAPDKEITILYGLAGIYTTLLFLKNDESSIAAWRSWFIFSLILYEETVLVKYSAIEEAVYLVDMTVVY